MLASRRRRELFLRSLEAVRSKYELLVAGYVVMPEHVHLLLNEPGRCDLSTAIKALKQSVSRRALRRLPMTAGQAELFPGAVAPPRFWQPRFYDFNVWTAKKRIEKLRYMHRNPVKRGLVARPELWHWSSFRH